jgi:hypothetical protein
MDTGGFTQAVEPRTPQHVDQVAGIQQAGRGKALLDIDGERYAVPVEVPGRQGTVDDQRQSQQEPARKVKSGQTESRVTDGSGGSRCELRYL